MNVKLLLGLALVLGGGLIGCSTVNHPVGEAPPVVLGHAMFDHDGKREDLYLIWTGGRHWLDEENRWCGEGEKYSGQFIFRVELAGDKAVDTTFDSLGDDLPDFFFVQDDIRPIYVADYNNDGQPDFNIISYGACRWSSCNLFTVLPSGKVKRLKIKDPEKGAVELGISRNDGDVSTDEFILTPKGFYYQAGSPGEDDLEFLDWHDDEKVFYYREEEIKTRWP